MTQLFSDTHIDFSSWQICDHTHRPKHTLSRQHRRTLSVTTHTHPNIPSPDLPDPTANTSSHAMFYPKHVTLLTPTWDYHSEMLRFSVRNTLSGLPNVQHTLFWPEYTNQITNTGLDFIVLPSNESVSPPASPTQISTQSLQKYNSV